MILYHGISIRKVSVDSTSLRNSQLVLNKWGDSIFIRKNRCEPDVLLSLSSIHQQFIMGFKSKFPSFLSYWDTLKPNAAVWELNIQNSLCLLMVTCNLTFLMIVSNDTVSLLRCRLISIGISNIELATVSHLLYPLPMVNYTPRGHLSIKYTLTIMRIPII